MIKQLHTNLFIGDLNACFFNNKEGWVVVHACKSPCHQRALHYRGNLSETHPNYLTYEKDNHLFLNMIDPPQPLFKPSLFSHSLDFIEKHISNQQVLIHCNHGLSRSPSLALLYLSKRAGTVSGKDFTNARNEFTQIFPPFKPGIGISLYLQKNWNVII